MKGALLALGLAAGIALAAPRAGAADICATDATLLESQYGLPGVTTILAAGQPLHVTAFGSSSTQGVGASSPDHTYPARLQAELRRLYPRSEITVVNRGVAGDDSLGMLARLDDDVIEARPDLVVWQTGTNSALRDVSVGEFYEHVIEGVRRMRAAGADVMLIGPQKSPRVDLAEHRAEFAEYLRAAGEVTRTAYFPRYEVMAGWLKSGQMTMPEMIDPDGLHMTDLSYDCLAKDVARMIANLARPPVAQR